MAQIEGRSEFTKGYRPSYRSARSVLFHLPTHASIKSKLPPGGEGVLLSTIFVFIQNINDQWFLLLVVQAGPRRMQFFIKLLIVINFVPITAYQSKSCKQKE